MIKMNEATIRPALLHTTRAWLTMLPASGAHDRQWLVDLASMLQQIRGVLGPAGLPDYCDRSFAAMLAIPFSIDILEAWKLRLDSIAKPIVQTPCAPPGPIPQDPIPQPGRIGAVTWVLLQLCSGVALASDVQPAYAILSQLGNSRLCGRHLASLPELHATIAAAIDNWLQPLWPLSLEGAAGPPRAGPVSLKAQARGAVKLITGILLTEEPQRIPGDLPPQEPGDREHFRAASPACSFKQHMGRLVAAMHLSKRSEPVRIVDAGRVLGV